MERNVWTRRFGLCLTLGLCLPIMSAPSVGAPSALCFEGINLSGAEYGEPGGAYGTAYIYPSEKTVKYFAEKGMNSVRLPFRWERLQPRPGERLDGEELQRLTAAVDLIRKHGMSVILDPHNYAYRDGKRLATDALPVYLFADFWARLAVEFANRDGVAFGLMNEPHDIPAADWLKAANAAIRSIRAVNARNLVLVPGTVWTGAHSWEKDIAGGANAVVMLGVEDPSNNYAYEVHQYLDEDYSGTHTACINAEAANQALVTFTAWLRANKKRGFLGEFGAAATAPCLDGLKRMLETVAQNGDVWLGWTYWAAGDWWPASEPMNVQPGQASERKQMSVLSAALKKGKAACTVP